MRLATFTAQNMSISKFGDRRGFRCLLLAEVSHDEADCTLIIIEPTVDYGFHEIREFRRVLTIQQKKKSENFGLKSNGTVIFRKIRSEIEDYLQRWSGTAEISLPFAESLSSFQSLDVSQP